MRSLFRQRLHSVAGQQYLQRLIILFPSAILKWSHLLSASMGLYLHKPLSFMEIQKTSAISGISSKPDNSPKTFYGLPQGSSLNAVVSDKIDDHNYLLKLSNGQTVHAQTQNELLPGQVLKLEVVKTGALPELRIVWPEQPGSTDASVLQNALKQLLPKQVNLGDFALALRQMAASSTEKAHPISTAIQDALGSFLSKEELMTAEGVKKGIDNSGVFLEAKLAQQLTPQGDIKGQLLALANTLQKTLSAQVNAGLALAVNQDLSEPLEAAHALLTKTEGALARIVLDQLASLPQENEPQTAWQLSIPFTDGAHTNAATLTIKREGHYNSLHSPPNWSVVLELNPPGLGTLNCKISLVNDKVDTYFWSESESSALQVQDHLDVLAQRYSEAGLTAGHLNVVDGARMIAGALEKELIPALVDEFA